MEYRRENRVVLSTEREHKSLYSWSIKEFDRNGKQIGSDQIPWEWSLRFEVIELTPNCTLKFNNEQEDQQAETSKAEISEYLYGKLRSSERRREAGSYSMFGTKRTISEFDLFIYKAMQGEDRCRLWGSIGYTAEWDFEDVAQQDSVQIYIYLSAERYERLLKFVTFPRPTGAEVRLKGVSGFYSAWSPSIRTDSIRILANVKDQGLENPEGLSFDPPVLGHVEEFELSIKQQYPLILKER
ncbi:hypothetical protein [Bradyrhizobium sp. NP1]|uniref:hypothetical protein n=1 Tax=Bradyrhizobium sp. NP1 TaxID=3049772 RepID=UPI0025A4EEC8|nr:hypothetical protein [Bradyrhizobium sp. NP1]WJR76023.1 hypothetical protein QOU61_25045 [Bradyrhizobium sp. NP1]